MRIGEVPLIDVHIASQEPSTSARACHGDPYADVCGAWKKLMQCGWAIIIRPQPE